MSSITTLNRVFTTFLFNRPTFAPLATLSNATSLIEGWESFISICKVSEILTWVLYCLLLTIASNSSATFIIWSSKGISLPFNPSG